MIYAQPAIVACISTLSKTRLLLSLSQGVGKRPAYLALDHCFENCSLRESLALIGRRTPHFNLAYSILFIPSTPTIKMSCEACFLGHSLF